MEWGMGKKFVQIAAICLGLALLSPLGGVRSATASSLGDQMVEVGIYFDGGALPGANVVNQMGEGFRLGYYQDGGDFVQLASTPVSDISVVKAMNVYLYSYDPSGNANYADGVGPGGDGAVVIGEYHLRLPGSYDGFAAAQAEAARYADGFVCYVDGVFQARVGNYPDRAQALAAQETLAAQGVEAVLCGSSTAAVNVVRSGTSEILFQYDGAGRVPALAVEPNAAGDQGEDYTTRFHSIYWRGGFCFERVDGGDLTISNLLPLDDYVKGVVPNEMSSNWPVEALKAQAVCARTYSLRLMEGMRHGGVFDLCNEPHCQTYLGTNGSTATSDRAVEETAGETVTYQGAYIDAVYYSSNGGASEDSSVVWGSDQASYPYLIGVIDPYEALVADRIPNYRWMRTLSGGQLQQMMLDYGYQASVIADARVEEYSDTGNPISIILTDSTGREYTINSRRLVNYFGLRSYRYFFGGSGGQLLVNGKPVDSLDGMYAIDGSGNTVAVGSGSYVVTGDGSVIQAASGGGGSGAGSFTISGSGWGHNVGLSQWGAYAQALEGRDYRQILQFYYKGITVG